MLAINGGLNGTLHHNNHHSNHAAGEEARAEVDVLNSRLEKTSQLTKKIRSSMGRLEATAKTVSDVSRPLNGETRELQLLGRNIDSVIAAIERLRQRADSKNDEEQVIRGGPDQAGLSSYLASIKRINKALSDMQASNLRSTKQSMADLEQLVQSSSSQLENYFDRLLRAETPRSVEPLQYVPKNRPFPGLSQDTTTRLGLINSHLAEERQRQQQQQHRPMAGAPELALVKLYMDARAPYVATTLANLATATLNMTKKKNATAIYRVGTSGVGMYARSMEGIFLAEYDNICRIFTRDDWGPVFQAVCQPALVELGRMLRELNTHIKAHMSTDCYLAYEIVEIISGLSNNLETRTGELKSTLAASLKPVRETAKSSLAELLEDTKRRVNGLQTLPADGAALLVVTETMTRLLTMVDFLRPLSSIMVSLGDGGWRGLAGSAKGVSDGIPSLASFDVGADGEKIFANYCTDTIESLLMVIEARARALLTKKSVLGVFLANNVIIIERMLRDSPLAPLLKSRLGMIEQTRKKAIGFYTEPCKELSMHLFDVIHTGKSQRPTSGQGAVDSSSILKALGSKDKEQIKGKFQSFNASFDELVTRHNQYAMEREVRQLFARDIQGKLEPLYNRFWDRYHGVDKGKGKYVKYDKSSIAAVFLSLY